MSLKPELSAALAWAISNQPRALVRKLPKQAYAPWTVEEDQALVEGFLAGQSTETLAVEHRRTEGAIQSRLRKIALDCLGHLGGAQLATDQHQLER